MGRITRCCPPPQDACKRVRGSKHTMLPCLAQPSLLCASPLAPASASVSPLTKRRLWWEVGLRPAAARTPAIWRQPHSRRAGRGGAARAKLLDGLAELQYHMQDLDWVQFRQFSHFTRSLEAIQHLDSWHAWQAVRPVNIQALGCTGLYCGAGPVLILVPVLKLP